MTDKPPPPDPEITSQYKALDGDVSAAIAAAEALTEEAVEVHRSFRSRALELAALVVDDDPQQLKLLKVLCAPYFQRVDVAGSFSEAKGRVLKNAYDFVIVDMRLLPNGTGADLAVQIRHESRNPRVPVVLISAEENIATLREWQRYCQADACVSKFGLRSRLPQLVRELVASAAG